MLAMLSGVALAIRNAMEREVFRVVMYRNCVITILRFDDETPLSINFTEDKIRIIRNKDIILPDNFVNDVRSIIEQGWRQVYAAVSYRNGLETSRIDCRRDSQSMNKNQRKIPN